MTTIAAFEVSTSVLIDQARTTLRAFQAPEDAPRVAELAPEGLKAQEFKADLDKAAKELETVEADQERAKQAYQKEADEDQAVAEEGYRWVLRTHAKARSYLSDVDSDPDDIPGKLRFGHLRSARARGVKYEMLVLLPEVTALAGKLTGVGAGPEFVAEGQDILRRLGVELQETADAKAKREALTRKVRRQEIVTSRVLRKLVAADEAASLARPERAPAFRLDVINAELGRLAAQHEARLVARTRPVNDE
ncbi:MAG: hypothetical protein HY904_09520 [Deltaproteobacteria bacterium]|nr:hypothetical protein [Deltaproteobacteria bacterium]